MVVLCQDTCSTFFYIMLFLIKIITKSKKINSKNEISILRGFGVLGFWGFGLGLGLRLGLRLGLGLANPNPSLDPNPTPSYSVPRERRRARRQG